MATEHGFREANFPHLVTIDADFVVSAIVETELFHRECLAFSRRLRIESIRVVSSPFLRLEFLQAWRKALTRHAVPRSAALQTRFWEDPSEGRMAYFERGEQLFDAFMDLFSYVETRLSRPLQRETRVQMAQHNLNSMDACLLASARRAGTDHIVSLDSDFRRVDDIHLWNDNIPAKRQAARRRKRS